MGYSLAFKLSTLRKVLPPQNRSLSEVTRELGLGRNTIGNWLKQSREGLLQGSVSVQSPKNYLENEKMQLLLEAEKISEEDMGKFLRENGLHSEHLEKWREEMNEKKQSSGSHSEDKQKISELKKELEKVKKDCARKEKELIRKEKALAEVTALLVLKKKLNEILGENEDE